MSWIQGYDGKELYIKMCSFDWKKALKTLYKIG